MKKTVCGILSLVLLFVLAGCDKSYLWSLDIRSSDEKVSIVVDGEASDSFSFSSNDFNRQPKANYSNIDFSKTENNDANVKIYKFELTSSTSDTYSLSLKLVDANKYVVDFLRVGIIVDGELRVYKYNNIFEEIYHKENDPDSILHFKSKSKIFNGLSLELSAGEPKEIVVFLWLEEAELYNKKGERYTGWADHSYDASPVMLDMEIK